MIVLEDFDSTAFQYTMLRMKRYLKREKKLKVGKDELRSNLMLKINLLLAKLMKNYFMF